MGASERWYAFICPTVTWSSQRTVGLIVVVGYRHWFLKLVVSLLHPSRFYPTYPTPYIGVSNSITILFLSIGTRRVYSSSVPVHHQDLCQNLQQHIRQTTDDNRKTKTSHHPHYCRVKKFVKSCLMEKWRRKEPNWFMSQIRFRVNAPSLRKVIYMYMNTEQRLPRVWCPCQSYGNVRKIRTFAVSIWHTLGQSLRDDIPVTRSCAVFHVVHCKAFIAGVFASRDSPSDDNDSGISPRIDPVVEHCPTLVCIW